MTAIKDIGGFARDFVPMGTSGVVVDSGGWSSRARVGFKIDGGFFSSDSIVEDDEVR